MAQLVPLHRPPDLQRRSTVAVVLGGGGAKVNEIAKTLFLCEGTVRNKISNAISKLNARNRTDAVRIAIENGWL